MLNKMTKKLLAVFAAAVLLITTAIPALAVDTGVVTATVTPGIISVTLDTASIGYGTVNIPSVDLIPATPSADKIIGATNNGGIPENFTIRGANATGTGIPPKTWTIVDGAVGGATTYNYNHKFIDCGSSNSCASPAAANLMDTTPETFATSVAKEGTKYFKLRLSTPTETGGDLTEHSTSVTVTASAT